MSELRQQIGQLLIMGFVGCEIDQDNPVLESLKMDGIGGVLLFDYDVATKCYGKNLKNIEQIKHLTQQLKSHAKQANHPSLLVAVDYEGGAVDRFTKINGCIKTLQPKDLARLSDEAIFVEALKMANMLKDLGFNLNFAPVIDLNLNASTGIIGRKGRSFSSDPEVVIRVARQFVHAFRECGLICAYKHFPGHGSAEGDTHEGFVDVTQHFHTDELFPYQILLNEPYSSVMVMTAHVINRQLDSSGRPATLSKTILNDLLRQKIGYDGVIVSDDLQMHAISEHYSLDEALSLTLNAGADMLIFANQLGTNTAKDIIDRIEALVHSGAIPAARIEESYQRVLNLKKFI